MNILFIGTDTVSEYNCEEWRCALPFRALRRAGYPCELIHVEQWLEQLDDEFSNRADLIFYQRNAFAEAMTKFLYYQARGKVIVVDFDDAYDLMVPATGSPSADFWTFGKQEVDGKPTILDPHPLKVLRWGAKMANAVTSPSKVILKDWAPFIRKGYIIPNYIETGLYKRWDTYREPNTIYLGGGGSMGHIRSWNDSGLPIALRRVVHEDKRVTILLAGDGRAYGKVDVPKNNKAVLGWVPNVLYSRSLSRFDIGLIPLAGEYDRRRSWIKPAEYSIMGIPYIGSNYEPNRNVSPAGKLVKNTADAWYEAIMDSISRIDEIKKEARDLIPQQIERFDIDKNIDKLIGIYEQIYKEADK